MYRAVHTAYIFNAYSLCILYTHVQRIYIYYTVYCTYTSTCMCIYFHECSRRYETIFLIAISITKTSVFYFAVSCKLNRV